MFSSGQHVHASCDFDRSSIASLLYKIGAKRVSYREPDLPAVTVIQSLRLPLQYIS